MAALEEIVPGLLHWTAFHPRIHSDVHSAYLVGAHAALDPLLPQDDDVAGELERLGPPRTVLLSNRHHLRDSAHLAERFGASIRCHEAGLHEFGADDPEVQPFAFGDEVAPGVRALELSALCPEETALHVPDVGPGVLAFADSVMRGEDGQLMLVPAQFRGDDPAAVEAALRARLRELLDYDFDALVLAHGAPMARGGKDALAALVG